MSEPKTANQHNAQLTGEARVFSKSVQKRIDAQTGQKLYTQSAVDTARCNERSAAITALRIMCEGKGGAAMNAVCEDYPEMRQLLDAMLRERDCKPSYKDDLRLDIGNLDYAKQYLKAATADSDDAFDIAFNDVVDTLRRERDERWKDALTNEGKGGTAMTDIFKERDELLKERDQARQELREALDCRKAQSILAKHAKEAQ